MTVIVNTIQQIKVISMTHDCEKTDLLAANPASLKKLSNNNKKEINRWKAPLASQAYPQINKTTMEILP